MTQHRHNKNDDKVPETAEVLEPAAKAHEELIPVTEVKHESDELAKAQAKATENWDRLLRLQAEMDNLKRRSERDVASAHKFALEKFVKELLPVVDSFEMALKTPASEASKVILDGIELTHKMLLDVLQKQQVKQIDPEGQPFNPEQHEAVSTQVNANVDANTVLFVMQKGYLLNDRLIRPALVVVSTT